MQVYKPKDTLFWLCEHGRTLNSPDFTTFFNGLGAGNSIRHFHYQTLKEPFPIFDAQPIWVKQGIVRLRWPLPAYAIMVKKQHDEDNVLALFDSFILKWRNADKKNTLNLLHRMDANGRTHIIFVPRVDSREKRKAPKISNDFGGCEVGGRINIESLNEWLCEKKKSVDEIEQMLATIAPEHDEIDELESVLND